MRAAQDGLIAFHKKRIVCSPLNFASLPDNSRFLENIFGEYYLHISLAAEECDSELCDVWSGLENEKLIKQHILTLVGTHTGELVIVGLIAAGPLFVFDCNQYLIGVNI